MLFCSVFFPSLLWQFRQQASTVMALLIVLVGFCSVFPSLLWQFHQQASTVMTLLIVLVGFCSVFPSLLWQFRQQASTVMTLLTVLVSFCRVFPSLLWQQQALPHDAMLIVCLPSSGEAASKKSKQNLSAIFHTYISGWQSASPFIWVAGHLSRTHMHIYK